MASHEHRSHLGVLDGWRALSILLVIACHMLPLGPKSLQLNVAAGLAGMALFFTLSGFLITRSLLAHSNVKVFLVRRVFRIEPLAFTAALLFLLLQRCDLSFYLPHLLYFINYDHAHITPLTAHFWSLCVEIQFYIGIALLVAMLGIRALPLVLLGAVFITGLRVYEGVTVSIVTHLRLDEILIGCVLALAYEQYLGKIGDAWLALVARVPLLVWLAMYLLSCHSSTGALQYARPYFAASLVAHTLVNDSAANVWLKNRTLRYVAEISFALYVIHPVTMYGWFGSGTTTTKYLKRPFCIFAAFVLAHLSTRYLEQPLTHVGKRLSRAISPNQRTG